MTLIKSFFTEIFFFFFFFFFFAETCNCYRDNVCDDTLLYTSSEKLVMCLYGPVFTFSQTKLNNKLALKGLKCSSSSSSEGREPATFDTRQGKGQSDRQRALRACVLRVNCERLTNNFLKLQWNFSEKTHYTEHLSVVNTIKAIVSCAI